MNASSADAEGNLRGGWLFLWNETPDDFEEKEALIKAASPEVAPPPQAASINVPTSRNKANFRIGKTLL